jgi:WD40 repeat protein
LISCAQLPPLPEISLCVLDAPENKFYCKFLNSDEITELEVSKADKYLAMSSSDFEKIQIYIENLKKLAQKKCREK